MPRRVAGGVFMRRLCFWISAAGAALTATGLTAPALADVAVVGAMSDNTLFEDPQGSLSDALGSYVFAGVTMQGLRRRGLVSFDLSSIPAGSTITGVSLTLHMSRTSAAAEPVSL